VTPKQQEAMHALIDAFSVEKPKRAPVAMQAAALSEVCNALMSTATVSLAADPERRAAMLKVATGKPDEKPSKESAVAALGHYLMGTKPDDETEDE
jgi:hypothetical protein